MVNLTKRVYQITANFPVHQRYSLGDQMQRAATSILSNVAEGWYRSRNEWLRYMRIAYGSAAELESQLLLASELGFCDRISYESVCEVLENVMRLLNYYTHKSRH